uniref:Uncharacterized protein n=1 Tax=Solanum tuberosum TaxID=4113 RepID=M1DSK4_SOLTU
MFHCSFSGCHLGFRPSSGNPKPHSFSPFSGETPPKQPPNDHLSPPPKPLYFLLFFPMTVIRSSSKQPYCPVSLFVLIIFSGELTMPEKLAVITKPTTLPTLTAFTHSKPHKKRPSIAGEQQRRPNTIGKQISSHTTLLYRYQSHSPSPFTFSSLFFYRNFGLKSVNSDENTSSYHHTVTTLSSCEQLQVNTKPFTTELH